MRDDDKDRDALLEDLEKLRASERRYRDLVEKLRDVIYTVDASGTLTYLSPSVESFIGYPLEELEGRSFAEFIHPEDFQRAAKDFAALLSGKSTVADYRFFTKTGELRWMRTSNHPVRVGDRVVGAQGVITDITETKLVDQRLEEQWSQFMAMIRAFPEILYVADPETYEILFVNQVLEDLLGKDPVGLECYREFQGKDAPCEFCTNEIILKERKPYTWEHYNPILKRRYRVTDQIIRWSDGREVRFELAIDITDQEDDGE